ncbi:MAG: hypothetical protein QOF98_2659 [Streptomyces sp.]|nr:hypothetical protein [Streptomyces sp.]
MAPESAQSPRAPALAVPRRRVTPGDVGRLAVRRVRSAPGTHIWLAILAVTSLIGAELPARLRSPLLHGVSTNLVELTEHPIRVLVASALWLDSPADLVFYAVVFDLVHATAERWLGTLRWLLVVAAAHIGATLVSQTAVFVDIRDARLPGSLAYTVDIGVSYGIAGVVGILAYRVPWPWRCGYLAGALAYFGYPVLDNGGFTDLGHLSALLIGLCGYVLTGAVTYAGTCTATRTATWTVTPPRRAAGAAPPRSRPRRWTP